MSTDKQEIELTFVMSSASEAEALRSFLLQQANEGGEVAVSDIHLDSAAGALSREQIVTALLTFSLNVSAGVLGNIIYNAFQESPTAQCVANEKPLTNKDVQDKAALDSTLRVVARPVAPTNR